MHIQDNDTQRNLSTGSEPDCGSCQIANMASVTNADDNDKNSILFVPSGMYAP